MSVNEKMTAIANAIRTKTGGTQALTLDDMAAAIAGITGDGAATGLDYDMGEFILDADTTWGPDVPHDLGEQPGFCLVWTDDYVGVTNPDTTYATALGYAWLDQIMGLENWFTSAAKGIGTTIHFTQSKGNTGMNVGKPTSGMYAVSVGGVTGGGDCTPEVIPLVKMNNSTYWRAGVTYRYFVSRAWWNVGGAANAE